MYPSLLLEWVLFVQSRLLLRMSQSRLQVTNRNDEDSCHPPPDSYVTGDELQGRAVGECILTGRGCQAIRPKSKVQSPVSTFHRRPRRWTFDFGHWTLDVGLFR